MNTRSQEQVDLQREELAIRRAAVTALFLCLLCFAVGYFTLPVFFDFPTELVDRLAFAVQASVFVLIWVLVGVGMVSWGRRHSVADIGGSASEPPSSRIAIQAAFLQNTLEQAVLAVGAYLALASLIGGAWLSLIVIAIIIFAVGRVLFLFGYRRYPTVARGRALGMALTVIPTLAGYVLAIALIAVQS
ncbi:MAPEG family protein [Chlorogloeopsis sp. ULAP01]|uniref:MAPEG family protein n=1 Tax=Chlorogloeopsis sp. ULAP01 TaxID=3056483 RepID=UPI0025AB13E5|nr:MAPEG family protein [Chlorogloeopsis sp. ULAP01]MDM9384463.1 MAPEG family protein [Chlorogloeopsis sp. ULAP01]